MLPKMVRFMSLGAAEDDPWVWTSSWNSDMPAFFSGMPNGVMDNIYDDLDDSPQIWGHSAPVDPTEYQNEYIGQVIGIY